MLRSVRTTHAPGSGAFLNTVRPTHCARYGRTGSAHRRYSLCSGRLRFPASWRKQEFNQSYIRAIFIILWSI